MYKLHYFNFYGRAEPIRMLLAHAKIAFEDIRVPFPYWPGVKGNYEFGQLPVLEITDAEGKVKKYAQTLSILRYLSIQNGYYPKENAEQAWEIDSTLDAIYDLVNGLVNGIDGASTVGGFEVCLALLIDQAHRRDRGQAGASDDLHMFEFVDFDGALLFTRNQGFDITVVDFLFAIAEFFEALKQGLKLFFAVGFVAHGNQLGTKGMATGVFAQHQHVAIEPDGFSTHNFIRQAIFHHPILVNAGLVGKGVATHDGFVGWYGDTDE